MKIRSFPRYIQSGTFINMPPAQFPNRLYFATDTTQLFLDTGTAWQLTSLTIDILRAVSIFSSQIATSGGRLNVATAGGESTITLDSTADFPSTGNGQIIDSTNDRDDFTYTGKTATTLTGCAGILAHNIYALVIPKKKNIIIDENVSELRFFGNRGDGTIEELATIGITSYLSDFIVGKFGSLSSGNSRLAISAESYAGNALSATSNNGYGIIGTSIIAAGVYGDGPIGVQGHAKNFTASAYAIYGQGQAGTGGYFSGAQAAIELGSTGSASAPTHNAKFGAIVITSAGIMYINTSSPSPGTTWSKVGAQ